MLTFACALGPRSRRGASTIEARSAFNSMSRYKVRDANRSFLRPLSNLHRKETDDEKVVGFERISRRYAEHLTARNVRRRLPGIAHSQFLDHCSNDTRVPTTGVAILPLPSKTTLTVLGG